ncbi:MAG: 2-oxoacid:acceptor oxidoreductase family protein [Myxococcota bacterium]
MSVEREILFTGIGGQSVQLGALVLARAAAREGRHVMMLGTYGGTMRGGPTDSTLIVGDTPLTSPPIVARAWSAIVMHHAFFDPLRPKLGAGSLVVVNASLFEAELDRESLRVFDVPATAIATELGSPLAASMVLVAAYAALTGLLPLDALSAGMRESVPSYRRQHLETNDRALAAGYAAVPHGVVPAFPSTDRAA